MKRNLLAGLSALVILCSLVTLVAGPTLKNDRVVDADGKEIRVLDPSGTLREVRRPDGSLVDAAGPVDGGGRVAPESVLGGPGAPLAGSAMQPALITPAAAPTATIDRMTNGVGYYGYDLSYGLVLFGSPDTFYLSDGSNWRSQSGSSTYAVARFDHVESTGSALRYHFNSPAGGIFLQGESYTYSPQHHAKGTLMVEGPLVLEATELSTTGVMRGTVRIAANEPPPYAADYFSYYTSVVGAVVPFEIAYTLQSGFFHSGTFLSYFAYQSPGSVDFAHPLSVPAVEGLEIRGAPLAGTGHPVQYRAVAGFAGGAEREVTSRAVWSLTPASAGDITAGLLTPAPLATGELPVVLHAEFEQEGVTVAADMSVVIRAAGGAETDAEWETFQADSRHSGHVPIPLDPETFTFKWQKTIVADRSLNPVTAAGGKVYVSTLVYFAPGPSLFALDARDGETLWSKDFGDVFSVNPPAYAYGNVYVQTGRHAGNTFLWAFDANTGSQVFKAPHDAQWERYYAPTIVDDGVYVNGGSYGGMYAFDAFTGERRWFRGLLQYDQWTPAVDGTHAFAYVGGVLSAVRRDTGLVDYTITDPHFDWQGWSMGLAPVLGGMDDVIVVHDDRLLRFGLTSRSIVWEKSRLFRGQPSVADGVVYAIDNGGLVAVDQATGADLWSWRPASGSLTGTLIVTGTHVLASTGSATYAVELLSRQQVWSYPLGGALTLGEETLYIASGNGVLTAISLPEFTQVPVTSLEITGPDVVIEKSTTQYTATVHYADGRVRNRTGPADWSVTGAPFASIDGDGLMSTGELMTPSLPVTVHATFTERGVTVEDSHAVELVIGVPIDAFITRNLDAAAGYKEEVLRLLQRAVDHEQAARAVLMTERGGGGGEGALPNRVQALNRIVQALHWDDLGRTAVTRGLQELQEALESLHDPQRTGTVARPTPSIAPAPPAEPAPR